MSKTISCIVGGTIAGVVLAAIAFLSAPAKADTAAAQATFKAKCAMCHGPDGKGETATGKMMKVKDFSSEEVQKMSDADLTAAISSGKGKMPAYKTLTPEQVKDLVAYIRTFGKKK
jgi:mono/diheme cytochrome c family protein